MVQFDLIFLVILLMVENFFVNANYFRLCLKELSSFGYGILFLSLFLRNRKKCSAFFFSPCSKNIATLLHGMSLVLQLNPIHSPAIPDTAHEL